MPFRTRRRALGYPLRRLPTLDWKTESEEKKKKVAETETEDFDNFDLAFLLFEVLSRSIDRHARAKGNAMMASYRLKYHGGWKIMLERKFTLVDEIPQQAVFCKIRKAVRSGRRTLFVPCGDYRITRSCMQACFPDGSYKEVDETDKANFYRLYLRLMARQSIRLDKQNIQHRANELCSTSK